MTQNKNKIDQFHGNIFLIKLGGSILQNESLIESLCFDLKYLKKAGIKIVIVHGGSKAINQNLLKNDIKTHFVDGLRVTSLEAMKVIEMALCGQVNKLLVRKLNAVGVNAVGLSGSDNNMLLCDYYSEKHGCVGTIKSINTEILTHFNIVPVIAPVGIDDNGNAMNINADYAASHIAMALKADRLIYLTDQEGIYDANGNCYSELSYNTLKKLIQNNIVKDGMLTKAKAILGSLEKDFHYVHILNGNEPHRLIKSLFSKDNLGTICNSIEDSIIYPCEVAA